MTRSTTRSSGSSSKTSASSGASSTAKKSEPRKRSATTKSSEDGSEGKEGGGSSRARAPRAQSKPPAKASKVAAEAASELLELTGKDPESITGLERTEDGWTVQVEVVEVRRIPDTTDVLALYEVTTDAQGAMLGYRRVRRYARGVPGDD